MGLEAPRIIRTGSVIAILCGFFYVSAISLFNYSSVFELEAPKLNELTYRLHGEKVQSYEKLVSCDLQKADGTDSDTLILCDSEEQAKEHFKKYDMSTVRIAAEDEIYCYRSRDCAVAEL